MVVVTVAAVVAAAKPEATPAAATGAEVELMGVEAALLEAEAAETEERWATETEVRWAGTAVEVVVRVPAARARMAVSARRQGGVAKEMVAVLVLHLVGRT